ncbi:MAG: hypothetical protein BGN85_13970 [Alphaproteobacteria bacterium 64-11]|nr:RcnB family protein [Alphaproteobacteria bacterium]OJU13927.1 MAG: hypothetical protein BGN85_13970 [Alphaproteobacteria bacterium 64-11]
MKRFITTAAALALLTGTMGSAIAQDYGRHDHRPGPATHGPAMQGPAMHGPAMRGSAMDRHADHHDWRKGGHIARYDWNHGSRVDWRRHHLHQPPHGYEWRRVDGNYVLAAAATGLIASIILSSH